MPIHTVLGPIDPETLGLTSMHEHLFLDARSLFIPPKMPAPDTHVSMRTLGWLRWNLLGLPDNLVVDDQETVLQGLVAFKSAGGRGIVDMTNIGLGRRVADLPELARESNVHVMVGCGWYRDPSHPPAVADASVDELASALIDELTDGIAGTGIRPAIIGEIGTSEPVTPGEIKVLKASARASVETGSAINVHVEPAGRNGAQIVEVLLAEGADPGRVVLSHLDERLDLDYHLDLARRGVVLEYDTFGMEAYWDFPNRDPTDHQRFELLAALIAHGLEDRITLGCDVFCKTAHSAYGGMGYEHLPARVVPALFEEYGFSEEQLHKLLVTTPRRLLDRP